MSFVGLSGLRVMMGLGGGGRFVPLMLREIMKAAFFLEKILPEKTQELFYPGGI